MNINIVMTVLKKELLDLFRDKRTLIMSIVIPVLILPVMFGIMGKVMNNDTKTAMDNIKIAMVDPGNSSLGKYITAQKGVKIVNSSNIKEDVKNGKITLGISIPEDFDSKINQDANSAVSITYDNTSQNSDVSFSQIQSFIQKYSQQVVQSRLQKKNIDISILTPVAVQEITSAKESEATGKLIVGMILPFILVIYSITGPLASSSDLGAGEKERGTLEPLLTTKASRMSLLWGKFLAITVMALITVSAFLAGFGFSLMQKDSMFRGASLTGVSLDARAIAVLCAACLLTTMTFGALELSVSIYAKSFKEAQTYFSPLTLVGMILCFLVYMADVKNINPVYYNVPVTNVMCIMKEALAGIYNTGHIVTVFAWCIVYVILSISAAAFMFSREEVVFRT